jgi:hypothetical protein
VEQIYARGKEAWGYRIPVGDTEREHLRDLCARMLAFEGHYLAIYRDWLLDQARRPDVATQRFVAMRLCEVLYPDIAVCDALSALATGADAATHDAATTALTRLSDAYGAHGQI